jgi:signal peptidase II
MQKVNRPRFSWRDIVFIDIVLLVIIADQLSKFWIVKHLWPGEVLWDVGLLQIIHVQNTGAAFGIFKGHTTALIIVDFIGIFVFLYIVIVLRRRWPLVSKMPVLTGVGLIMGGLIGNLIDRLRTGYVTDFIDFKVWPVWNIADASTVIGTIILAYCLIFLAGRAQIRE